MICCMPPKEGMLTLGNFGARPLVGVEEQLAKKRKIGTRMKSLTNI